MAGQLDGFQQLRGPFGESGGYIGTNHVVNLPAQCVFVLYKTIHGEKPAAYALHGMAAQIVRSEQHFVYATFGVKPVRAVGECV